MTPAEVVTRASEDGVGLTLSPTGLRLSGDRQAVERWASQVRAQREAVIHHLRVAADPRVASLRDLLTALLLPDEIDAELARTLRDNALDEALPMYERAYTEYDRLGEPQRPQKGCAGRMTERWVSGHQPPIFEWRSKP